MRETERKTPAGAEWMAGRLPSILAEFPDALVPIGWETRLVGDNTYALSLSTGDRDAVLRFSAAELSRVHESPPIQKLILSKLRRGIGFLLTGRGSN